MKTFLSLLGAATLLYGCFIFSISPLYTFREAGEAVVWFTTNPSRLVEMVQVVPGHPRVLWAGWAFKVGGNTLFVSFTLPALAVTALWVGVAGYFLLPRKLKTL